MLEEITKYAELSSCLISLIAIFISIRTVRSQNRVALFDKKYEVYSQLRRILSVAEITMAVHKPGSSLSGKNAWDVILARMDWTPGDLEAIQSQRVTTEMIIRQMSFLYNDICIEEIEKLFVVFREYVELTYKNQKDEKNMWSYLSLHVQGEFEFPTDETDYSEKSSELDPCISAFFDTCTSKEIQEIREQMEESLDLARTIVFQLNVFRKKSRKVFGRCH